ncbi:MAG TPA: hypothetical protein VG479_09210, partial [Gaiellaceae bacterium]|nr:hypothetical protein [Gaiellaceae bacterium]
MSRSQALERYRALPLPSTSDEHWRFTDLRGFDPDAYAIDGAEARSVADSMLEIDAAGIADATEGGIEIVSAPAGITFEPLGDHELLGTLVGAEDKLTAHNAAVWQHGLLVRVPAGVELEKPLYVRVGSSTPGGSLFWRLLVVAEEGSRFTLIEESASTDPELESYSNAVAEVFVERGAKLEYVSI